MNLKLFHIEVHKFKQKEVAYRNKCFGSHIEKHPFTVRSGIYQVQYSKSLLVHFDEQYKNINVLQNNKLEVFRSFG